ncbi:hypothetical protein [Fuerstiella marisgermanici]|uniref:Uncharacterized protein n=1 Tax=Fuerstiella marisgermanici TaxID=1891926 RepID=A0A1P8WI42_9PLAN|nr:hypothetical protein [Fuerstiella marisgermanici]APZ93722.1 hypothetical protein Fuma_03340 [Fuerstiella marisgermanici]
MFTRPQFARLLAIQTLVFLHPSWLSLPAGLSGELPPPYLVEIRNYDWRADRQAEISALVADSAPAGRLPRDTETQIAERIVWKFDVGNSDYVTGVASCLEFDGTVHKFLFRTMPGEDEFHRVVAAELKRRGPNARMEGTGVKVRLISPVEYREIGDGIRAKIATKDFYWTRKNGVFLSDDTKRVFDVPTAHLTDHIKRGRGKDWYAYVDPSSTPRAARDLLIRQFETQTSVRMQQRDGEAETKHAVRRLFGQNAIDLTEILWTDVTSVIADWKYPSGTKPLKAHAIVNVQPKSELSALIRELRTSGGARSSVPQSADVSVSVNMRLPEMVRDSMKALVTNSLLHQTSAGRVLEDTIDEGDVRLSAWIKVNDDDATIHAVSPVSAEAVPSTELTSLFGGTVNEAGEAIVPLNVPFFGDVWPAKQVGAKIDNGQLRLSMPLDENEPSTKLTEEATTAITPDTLVLIRGDLSLWAADEDAPNDETESPGKSVFGHLEKLYQHWMVYRLPKRIRFLWFRSESPSIPVTSLFENLRADGDNRFEIRLTANRTGTELRADCTVGRELYGLLMARQMLSGIDVEKAESER